MQYRAVEVLSTQRCCRCSRFAYPTQCNSRPRPRPRPTATAQHEGRAHNSSNGTRTVHVDERNGDDSTIRFTHISDYYRHVGCTPNALQPRCSKPWLHCLPIDIALGSPREWQPYGDEAVGWSPRRDGSPMAKLLNAPRAHTQMLACGVLSGRDSLVANPSGAEGQGCHIQSRPAPLREPAHHHQDKLIVKQRLDGELLLYRRNGGTPPIGIAGPIPAESTPHAQRCGGHGHGAWHVPPVALDADRPAHTSNSKQVAPMAGQKVQGWTDKFCIKRFQADSVTALHCNFCNAGG